MPRNSKRDTADWPAPERWLAAALGAALWLLATAPDAHARRSGAPRTQRIDMVVIHSTGGPTCDPRTGRPVWVGAGTLEDNLREIEAHPKLGIHYMVDRDGSVRASVPESQVAHHVFRHSSRSIAIELVNDGDGRDPFPEPQLAALVALLKDIAQRRGIVRGGVVRHSDLDPAMLPCDRTQRRKVDPGPAYPHDAVLDRVFAPS
jgi:N-acetyl-anhydromuramyl-L-alanine amidase AmpD